MAKRYIENITIMADLNEVISLPTQVVVLEDSFTYSVAPVLKWTNGDGMVVTRPDTSISGDVVFEGTVTGYVHKIYCSVVVGDLDDNPKSVFPDEIDQFGLSKKDVNTADIPDVDDYQYFKAKTNRTSVEQYQLKQLTEGLASKIILARDINHTRNAVINIEKYCKSLNDKLVALENKVTALESKVDGIESRVSDLEDSVVVSAENVGTGSEVYAGSGISNPIGRKLKFKTLVAGTGITIDEAGTEICINADIPEAPEQSEVGMDNCGSGTFSADNISVCDEYIKFSDYMGIKFVQTEVSKSMLMVFGVGDGVAQGMKNAGRIVKGTRNFVMEMKTVNGFSGIDINGDTGKVNVFENSGSSHVDAVLSGGSAYSSSVAMK